MKQHELAEVFAGVYVVAYLAFGVPVLIAGQLASPFGLAPTLLVFGALAVAAALGALMAQKRADGNARRGATDRAEPARP